MVFGGCKDDPAAQDSNAATESTNAATASGNGAAATPKEAVVLKGNQAKAVVDVAKAIIRYTHLEYLQKPPATKDLAAIFNTKENEVKGKEVKAVLKEWINELAGWENCPIEWKNAFSGVAKYEFATGANPGPLHNKSAWAEGIWALVQPMKDLSEICNAILTADTDLNISDQIKKLDAVFELIKDEKFSKARKFFGSQKVKAIANGKGLIDSISDLNDRQDAPAKMVWVANSAQNNRISAIQSDWKVAGISNTMPAVKAVFDNAEDSAPVSRELTTLQLLFSLFGARNNVAKQDKGRTSLDFFDIVGDQGVNKSKCVFTSDASIFDGLYQKAIKDDKGRAFAQALGTHVQNNAELRRIYLIPPHVQVAELIQGIQGIDEASPNATAANAWFQLLPILNAAITAEASVPYIDVATIKALAPNEADIDAQLQNLTFMQKLCCKIAHLLHPNANNEDHGYGVTDSTFKAGQEGSVKPFKEALLKLINQELDKAIVRTSLNDATEYKPTSVTDFVKDKIVALGAIFAETRGASFITYESMYKDSHKKFNIEELAKLPVNAHKVFSVILRKLPGMLDKSSPVDISDLLHQVITDPAIRQALVKDIEKARSQEAAVPTSAA
ncbi:hypothetical protein [Cardinium endosymbiont of Tipula unca]|uniref:hypothetical protein n=1 Tax=Cardinium endosymbiont of Tipula unca TaxID=3066216 RepID=UPI0030CD3D89